MTTVELLVEGNAIELAMTRKLLALVPEDKPNWAPHPKSMPLGTLAMHVATIPRMVPACLDTAEFDIATHTHRDMTFRSQQAVLAEFDQSAALAVASLARANEAQLSQMWQLRMGERIFVNSPRALFLLHNYLCHFAHHRAQLGVYLRLLEIPVPGVYGPSADDQQK